VAKAAFYVDTDANERKRGERTGLETLVVHAVTDKCSMLGCFLIISGVLVNTLNTSPE